MAQQRKTSNANSRAGSARVARPGTSRSPSGVLLFDDFRDQLIIDRFDPVLSRMREGKRQAMRSENSEDVVTWNCFRSLRQIDPALWLPQLAALAVPGGADAQRFGHPGTRLSLWKRVSPPGGALRTTADEGDSEIDVLIEGDAFVWAIEAKFKSDISRRTTNDAGRNQVLRNIDVGSYYAGVRTFYFSLLVLDPQRSPVGVEAVETYRRTPAALRSALPHRVDGLANVAGIGVMRWSDVAAVLEQCASGSSVEWERLVAGRAVRWMRDRGVNAAPPELLAPPRG